MTIPFTVVCPGCGDKFDAYKKKFVGECSCGCRMTIDFSMLHHRKFRENLIRGNKINCIKLVRAITECGLLEAKELMDDIFIVLDKEVDNG